MEQKEIVEGNKEIVEFLGYKLAPCNNGKAWTSPHTYAKDDVLHIHGRLFNEQPHNNSYLKFHTSFNWIMPVALYIAKKHSIECIAKRYSKEEIFKEVVDYIKWRKTLPEHLQRKVNPKDWLEFFEGVE